MPEPSVNHVRDANREWPSGTLVARLDPASRLALVSAGVRREFASGSRLLSEGDRSRHAFLIHEGVVKVTADSADGRTALLAVRIAGDVVGELAGLGCGPRIASVTAAGLVRVGVIGHRELERLTDDHPEIRRLLIVAVGAKLKWSTRRRVDSGTLPVNVRVARVLFDLATAYGHSSGDSVVLGFGLTQPELASLIGASEPATHRALATLRRDGVLTTAYRGIAIHEMAKLRRACEIEENSLRCRRA